MKKQAWAVLALSATLAMTAGSSLAAAGQESDKTLQPEGKQTPAMVNLDGDKTFDDLELMLVAKGDDEKVPVIVRFTEKYDDMKVSKLEKEIGKVNKKHAFKYAYQGFSGELTKKQIEKLQKNPLIESIQYNAPVQADMGTAGDSFGSKKAAVDFGLTGDRDGNLTSYSPTDVVVAVIDTGIDANHVDLDGGKVLAFKDFVNDRTTAYDDQGHGTHVSGIIAGTGEGNALYKGVAPGAALVGVKVLDSAGSGTMADVDAGIEWAIANKDTYGIRVINLSLGTSGSSNGQDSTSMAVNNAYNAGIVAAVAAGNSGPRKATIGSPGAAVNALTVGAMADVGEKGFNVASFSSRGLTADGRMKPDIMAPGVNITAPKANGVNQYVTMSGTSMATPFTAGVVALMLDANYGLTPAQVHSTLFNTAEDWGPAGQDLDYGYGRLQGYEAIKAAGGFSGTGPDVPTHTAYSGSLAAKGASQTFNLPITSTTTPVAATLLMPGWTSSTSPDFDLFVYNPSGTLVGRAEGTSRQELVTFTPTVTGTYTVKVLSYTGTGAFLLDLSAK